MARLRHETELERHAPEDECQKHDHDRKIERRHDDAVGQGEGDEEPRASEHKPGLVSIPIGRDRIHHRIALLLVRPREKQDADAEIEAVKQHIHGDGDAEKRGPYERKPVSDRVHGVGS